MYVDLTARPRWYVLDGRQPVKAASVAEWAAWFAHHAHEAVVAVSTVGSITITTRFTGMDRALWDYAAPVLFETVAGDDAATVTVGSACTWAEAEQRHAACVRSLQSLSPSAHAPMNQAWAAALWRAVRHAVGCRVASFFPTSRG
jgi:hypothetical protein